MLKHILKNTETPFEHMHDFAAKARQNLTAVTSEDFKAMHDILYILEFEAGKQEILANNAKLKAREQAKKIEEAKSKKLGKNIVQVIGALGKLTRLEHALPNGDR